MFAYSHTCAFVYFWTLPESLPSKWQSASNLYKVYNVYWNPKLSESNNKWMSFLARAVNRPAVLVFEKFMHWNSRKSTTISWNEEVFFRWINNLDQTNLKTNLSLNNKLMKPKRREKNTPQQFVCICRLLFIQYFPNAKPKKKRILCLRVSSRVLRTAELCTGWYCVQK